MWRNVKKIPNCEINMRFIETWYGKSQKYRSGYLIFVVVCAPRAHEYSNDTHSLRYQWARGYATEKEMTLHTKINRKRRLQLLFIFCSFCFYCADPRFRGNWFPQIGMLLMHSRVLFSSNDFSSFRLVDFAPNRAHRLENTAQIFY